MTCSSSIHTSQPRVSTSTWVFDDQSAWVWLPYGIAEGEVHAGDLFVLEQDADHLAQPEVGAERQLADPIAVAVGVAVGPEVLLEIGPLAAAPIPAARRGSRARNGVRSRMPYLPLK